MKKLFLTAIILLLHVTFHSVKAQDCNAPAAPNVNWSGCDKSDAYLKTANLSNANLSNANLSGANLETANLSNANLSAANLETANLSDAILSGANLSNALMYTAHIEYANLSGANLSGANLETGLMYYTILSGADLSGANLKNAFLYDANLSGADLNHAYLFGAYLSDANLYGANLYGANLSRANLNSSSGGAILTGVVSGGIIGTPIALPVGWALVNGYLVGPGANLTNANLSNANLNGVDLTGATLTGVVSGGITGAPSALPAGWALVNGYLVGPGANLTNANLTNGNLTGANLTGAILTGVVSGGITGTPSALPAGWQLVYGNLLGPGANLSGVNLSGVGVNNPNLTNANLTNAILVGTELFGGNLSGADLSGANLRGANFSSVNLTGANLSGANLSGFLTAGITGTPSALPAGWALVTGYLVGPGANLYDANLSGADLTNFNFTGVSFWNTNLSGANLSGANLTNANLTGANLSGANLTGVVSGGITAASSYILPAGWQLINGYLVGPATCGDGRYAEQVISFNQKKAINETAVVSGRSQSSKALCAPQNNDTENFVSLGFGGDITLKFGKAIRNGDGNDIRVYESTFGNKSCTAYPEKARVFASQDGCRFVYLGEICQDGTVDLGALTWAQYVRLVDVSSKTTVYQSSGTPDGYDVDAVEALNGFETNPVLDPIAGGATGADYLPGQCRGGANIPVERSNKNNALGIPQGTDVVNFVSLGFGGKITLRFKYAVENNPTGLDLQVVETSYGNPSCNSYPEKARFEGSLDGATWTDLGELCQDGKLEMGTLPYLHLLRITDVSEKAKFSPSADGFDVDGVLAINQCTSSNTREAVEIVDDIHTADELEIGGMLELYPNPATESATFSFNSQNESAYGLNIVNALGQVVYSTEGRATEGANTIELNLENLSKGLYIVQLVKDGSKQQVSLVKK